MTTLHCPKARQSRPHSLLAFLCSVFKEHPNDRTRLPRREDGGATALGRRIETLRLPEGCRLPAGHSYGPDGPSERLVNLSTGADRVKRTVEPGRETRA